MEASQWLYCNLGSGLMCNDIISTLSIARSESYSWEVSCDYDLTECSARADLLYCALRDDVIETSSHIEFLIDVKS